MATNLEVRTEIILEHMPQCRIEALRQECAQAGDGDMVAVCDDAISGDFDSRHLVAQMLAREEIVSGCFGSWPRTSGDFSRP